MTHLERLVENVGNDRVFGAVISSLVDPDVLRGILRSAIAELRAIAAEPDVEDAFFDAYEKATSIFAAPAVAFTAMLDRIIGDDGK